MGRLLRRVLRRGLAMDFTVKRGSEKGSQKGFRKGSFQKVPRTPPRRVRPLRRAPYLRATKRGRQNWVGYAKGGNKDGRIFKSDRNYKSTSDQIEYK